MPYDVTIETTKGPIKTQINELKELEKLLIKYYDIYTSVDAKEVKDDEVKGKKR